MRSLCRELGDRNEQWPANLGTAVGEKKEVMEWSRPKEMSTDVPWRPESCRVERYNFEMALYILFELRKKPWVQTSLEAAGEGPH